MYGTGAPVDGERRGFFFVCLFNSVVNMHGLQCMVEAEKKRCFCFFMKLNYATTNKEHDILSLLLKLHFFSSKHPVRNEPKGSLFLSN